MDIAKSVIRPSEMVALVQFKLSMPKPSYESMDPNTRWCYEKLAQTSRSFTIVIQKLHEELRDPVCSIDQFDQYFDHTVSIY